MRIDGPCRWLASTFGYVVRQHWQLDPFGHSGVVGALSALGGMDSVFLSRIDRQVLTAACATHAESYLTY